MASRDGKLYPSSGQLHLALRIGEERPDKASSGSTRISNEPGETSSSRALARFLLDCTSPNLGANCRQAMRILLRRRKKELDCTQKRCEG